MKTLFRELRRSMSKREYRSYCSSLRAVSGFNTGIRVFADKRFGKGGANTRWSDSEY